jgi:hypothetical protein
MNTTRKKKQTAGKVIASGGFGCIFKPSLLCNQMLDKTNTQKNMVSKLMLKKYAIEEYEKITIFKSILKVIPNYNHYFLLDNFSICKPNKLTNMDLDNYKTKCTALKKRNITVKNINSQLDRLLVLNMPNGGTDIKHFITDSYSKTNLKSINNKLIQLLIHGILPMNKLNVYHCDIKDTNVLIDISIKNQNPNLYIRLIDWGLSVIIPNSKVGIPKKLYRRPFQYNVPFSSILFNKVFLINYEKYLKKFPNPTEYKIREFVINFINIWINERGKGHLDAINKFMGKLFLNDISEIKNKVIKNNIIEYEFTYYYIINYITKILIKYTINNKIELLDYFHNIYLKNIDIWGFVMIYVSFYEVFYKKFNKLDYYEIELLNKIKYIIIHFLYESPIEPININNLITELNNLDTLIGKIESNKIYEPWYYIKSINNKDNNK